MLAEKTLCYVRFRITNGTKGKIYDKKWHYLSDDFYESNDKFITTFDKAMDLIEFHYPMDIYEDPKIEVDYEIRGGFNDKLLFDCAW